MKARRTSDSAKLRFSRLELRPLEEDLVALQFQVAVQGAGQQLHGGDEEAVGLGEQGDGGEEFDFHERIWPQYLKSMLNIMDQY